MKPTVIVPLSEMLELREALEQAERDRATVASMREFKVSADKAFRRAPDLARLRRRVRELLGETEHDHVPQGPVRRDTVRGMAAIKVNK